jgi:SAM-dependent methyltransferase
MTVFKDYAKYYDLLYRDKDYAKEASFVLETLASLGCEPATLLDLGSGTGRHAMAMARLGVSVTGVDNSEVMLSMARSAKAAGLPHGVVSPEFHLGDARNVRLGRRYDAVTALFHVMSYQITEDDVLAAFATAREHLRPGGVFLFDFWYGPGVLTDRPTERNRDFEDEDVYVRRHALPVLHVNDNIVDVNYTIAIRRKVSGEEATLRETHRMRYWFLPELCYLLKSAGFTILTTGAWMKNSLPELDTWNAHVAAM